MSQIENVMIFAFTFEGYHLERIEFDNEFWSDMHLHLDYFWSNFFLAPEILLIKVPK